MKCQDVSLKKIRLRLSALGFLSIIRIRPKIEVHPVWYILFCRVDLEYPPTLQFQCMYKQGHRRSL